MLGWLLMHAQRRDTVWSEGVISIARGPSSLVCYVYRVDDIYISLISFYSVKFYHCTHCKKSFFFLTPFRH